MAAPSLPRKSVDSRGLALPCNHHQSQQHHTCLLARLDLQGWTSLVSPCNVDSVIRSSFPSPGPVRPMIVMCPYSSFLAFAAAYREDLT